ncbi:MAG: hypothetical protein F4X39_10165 [Acidobacteriia bacterium]|nr:hypothetical protein [Terriglobia bacterium]
MQARAVEWHPAACPRDVISFQKLESRIGRLISEVPFRLRNRRTGSDLRRSIISISHRQHYLTKLTYRAEDVFRLVRSA